MFSFFEESMTDSMQRVRKFKSQAVSLGTGIGRLGGGAPGQPCRATPRLRRTVNRHHAPTLTHAPRPGIRLRDSDRRLRVFSQLNLAVEQLLAGVTVVTA